MPYGSIGAYDYYNRPVYEDMTFENVRIPMGNNGLFINCTFVGVTFIEADINCTDGDWNGAGAYEWGSDDNGNTIPDTSEMNYPRFTEDDGSPMVTDPANHPSATAIEHTRDRSNNIRFESCTFLGSIAGDRISEFTHWRNKIQMTGDTRFYIDPNDEDLLLQPDASDLQNLLNSLSADDRFELSKSSIMMPGWSVDVGNFENLIGPRIKLSGTIIAGIFDIRGTAEVFGTLLMTFRPIPNQGPLSWGGQPDAFNTTIGYFDSADGDQEGNSGISGFGEIRLRYNPDTVLPDGIPWPVSIGVVEDSYVEGRN